MNNEQDHGRSKYRRVIHDIDDPTKTVIVDIYSVLVAFDVQCPARQHASKKLLCAGIRGKGDATQDLKETIVAVERAIQLESTKHSKEREEVQRHAIGSKGELSTKPGQDVTTNESIPVTLYPNGWHVFMVMDDRGTNPIGFRVGWPCNDGTTFLVAHYMAAEKPEDNPSLSWCKNAAERQAERFNKEGKRPEEWSGFHKSAQETKNV